ncbi:unnamed protein product [Hermetia illucens]|uniref:Actin-related protein 6 n=1 Tax=Hermetia illucens TaxID=343691 RepID=A0A7R8YV30_HERIL|nr:actin-related protein 6 [Hermetia illucens]CAD7083399.1 unnamed protein product [Hermetia illucens]
MNNICILDNGAYTAKVGLASQEAPQLIPNCIMKAKSERRRAFIGDQIKECRDASGLFYLLPFQRGYLLNWDTQKTVWDHIFSPDCCGINLSEKTLIITEPHFNFHSIQEALTEIFFEEYECDALFRTTAADLSALHHLKSNTVPADCCIIVDMGYSFTHIVPYVKGEKIKNAIRRIDVGGKVLTNHLKEIISYRHLNMMDESYVVNQIKEDVCFVSSDFQRDMKTQKLRYPENTIIQEYVLPDFTTVNRGYVKKPEGPAPEQQTIKLNNERFTVPELLFNPSDVGIQQMGVSEAIMNALDSCPPPVHHVLLENIVVTGGCALIPGMGERLQTELRALAPDDMEVKVIITEDPVAFPWQGGRVLCQSTDFSEMILTREEYEEEGVGASIEKFDP